MPNTYYNNVTVRNNIYYKLVLKIRKKIKQRVI